MNLRDYLNEHGIQQAEFAKAVGVTPATINRICKGYTVPRRALMAKIITATKNQVTGEDLLLPPPVTANITSQPED